MTEAPAPDDGRSAPTGVVGILLAAGRGSRFGGAKLLARLADGTPVVARSLATLAGAVDTVVAVVRPADCELAALLKSGGAIVTVCPTADQGMGASLAWGVRAASAARGWVVALGDMPWIAPATVAAVAARIRGGAVLAVPRVSGQRGHPVGFGRAQFEALASLDGDAGARAIVAAAPAEAFIDVEDPGAIADIDVPADLAQPLIAVCQRSG